MLSPQLLKEIQKVQLKAGKQASEILSGNYLSAFKGQGIEFDEVREYVVGDDVRAIDWNVSARMQTPFIKVFREERQMTVMLMIDVSASQLFGSREKSKNKTSAELAAVLAFLATKNNDKVGLLLFSSRVEHFIPPKKGRAHIWNLIRTIMTFKSQEKGTSIDGAVEHMLRLKVKKSLCFLISDFYGEINVKNLSLLQRKHDLVSVLVSDPNEREMPKIGMVHLIDSETNQVKLYDFSSSKNVKEFRRNSLNRVQKLKKTLLKNKIDIFEVDTVESVVPPLVAYLHKKEGRRS